MKNIIKYVLVTMMMCVLTACGSGNASDSEIAEEGALVVKEIHHSNYQNYEIEYEYDQDGNLVKIKEYDSYGTPRAEYEYFEDGKKKKEVQYNLEGGVSREIEWNRKGYVVYSADYDIDGNIRDKREAELDANDEIIKWTFYNGDGIVEERVIKYEYDENGNKIKETCEINGDSFITEYENEYYANGEIKKVIEYVSDYKTEKIYDKNGNEVSNVRYYNSEIVSKTEAEYDEQGNEIKYIHYENDQIVEEREYDKDGNLIREFIAAYDGSIGEYTSYTEIKYEYDKNGMQIKTVRYESLEDMEYISECEYEYDKNGNVTKQIIKHDGKVSGQIEYLYE